MKSVPDAWVRVFPLKKWLVQSGDGREAYFFTTDKLLQILEGK